MNEPLEVPEYKYIYPPNARDQEQLDIMLRMETEDKDPMAPEHIEQEILFQTDFWHVSNNRFPYAGAEKHFLVVSMQPIYHLEDMPVEMWMDLLAVWKRLIEEYHLEGGGLCFRFGDPAKSGASLTRLHCHIFMPKEGEKVKPSIGGRKELKEGLTVRSLKDLIER